eukprot:CAMPEP_0172728080 /NCGR_PEP_ID=MMETSP1074-20121228/92041_1 /TAXON_ID=2916 /ORGANISM="Ceratium fusus, Strain PA161109" /LENGTH=551 /DNA_ID=CAMNT_0013555295 /DNA_START=10 /DNA_END=1665 /DNA_ORIENTATION=-
MPPKCKGNGKRKGAAPPAPKPAVARAVPVPYRLRPKAASSGSNGSTTTIEKSKPEFPPLPICPATFRDTERLETGPLRHALVVAEPPRPAEAWRTFLDGMLTTFDMIRNGIVVLPEGAIVEPGPCDELHPAVKELMIVAEAHDVVIVGGSMVETDAKKPGQSWNTCPVVGKTGLLGSYRKRMLGSLDGMKARETASNIGIFNTPAGRLGVLICLDIEEDMLLLETASSCDVIANPAHIPYVPAGLWEHAVQPVQRRLQWWARACGVTILRSDPRPPAGMGTSMAITPCETFLGTEARSSIIQVVMPTNQKRQQLLSWHVARMRTEPLDNCGASFTVVAQEAGSYGDHMGIESLPYFTDSGLELRSCPQGFAVHRASNGCLLHVLPLPEPVTSIVKGGGDLAATYLFGKNFAVRSVAGKQWRISVRHNNVDVSFEELFAEYPPSDEARLFWEAAACPRSTSRQGCLLSSPASPAATGLDSAHGHSVDDTEHVVRTQTGSSTHVEAHGLELQAAIGQDSASIAVQLCSEIQGLAHELMACVQQLNSVVEGQAK